MTLQRHCAPFSGRKYGTGSIQVGSTTLSYVYNPTPIYSSIAANANFTIEGWIYQTAQASAQPGIFSNYTSGGTSAISFFAGHTGDSSTRYQLYFNNVFPAVSGGTVALNTWVHFAIVRNGTGSNNVTLYLNGTSLGTCSGNSALVFANPFYIGAAGDALGTAYFQGYIDDFRITNGYARYTANFTPPTSALPTY